MIVLSVLLVMAIIMLIAVRKAYWTEYTQRLQRVYFLSCRGMPRREHLTQDQCCWWYDMQSSAWVWAKPGLKDPEQWPYWAPHYVFPIPNHGD